MSTKYKVVGPAFKGHKTGETFEAELDPELERRAKDRGQIRVIRRDKHEEEETADAQADRAL